MWRTLNSDIVTQSNNLSAQLSTHDAGIKSLLNNRGCVKNVQRIYKTGIRVISDGSYIIQIQPINLSKSILLVRNCIYDLNPYASGNSGNSGYLISTLQDSSIRLTTTVSVHDDLISIDIYDAQVVEFY